MEVAVKIQFLEPGKVCKVLAAYFEPLRNMEHAVFAARGCI
jgi:hypothetical protein